MIDAFKVWLEYSVDSDRDDDLSRWNNAIDTGDFKLFKKALQGQDMSRIQHFLEHQDQSPELSCTYNNRYNRIRWRRAEDLILKWSDPGDVIIDIGAGSHANVIDRLITRAPDRHYVICDLTTPLLLAYYNLGKHHRVHYLNEKDIVDPQTFLMDIIKKHDCLLVPHHMSYVFYDLPEHSVFYNSYSMGEMTSVEIDNYMDMVGTTRSKLISENYWDSGQYTKCHLCNTPVLPVKPFVPDHFHIVDQRDPHVPTNPGAKIVVYKV
jgi:hypothetical protein